MHFFELGVCPKTNAIFDVRECTILQCSLSFYGVSSFKGLSIELRTRPSYTKTNNQIKNKETNAIISNRN